MAILKKNNLIFALLVLIGCSRMLWNLYQWPKQANWLIWITPKPQVFIDKHYFLKKTVTFEMASGVLHRFDLSSENQWPIDSTLLISTYTLIHALDRPFWFEEGRWKKIVYHHACNKKTFLKDVLRKEKIKEVAVEVVYPDNKKFSRSVNCDR